jgi:hypothetical protein
MLGQANTGVCVVTRHGWQEMVSEQASHAKPVGDGEYEARNALKNIRDVLDIGAPTRARYKDIARRIVWYSWCFDVLGARI